MATCTELYIDTLGGLDLDGSTDKNLPYFVVENLATLGTGSNEIVLKRTGLVEIRRVVDLSTVTEWIVNLWHGKWLCMLPKLGPAFFGCLVDFPDTIFKTEM